MPGGKVPYWTVAWAVFDREANRGAAWWKPITAWPVPGGGGTSGKTSHCSPVGVFAGLVARPAITTV